MTLLRGSTDYGYINTRIRAMATALLTNDFLIQLLRSANVDALNNDLEETDYSNDIQEATKEFPITVKDHAIRILETAININFKRTLIKVRNMTEGEPRELLNLVLLRWDIYNLKTVIRGKFFGLNNIDIEKYFIAGGDMSEDLIPEVIKSKGLVNIWEILETSDMPFISDIKEAYHEFVDTGNLSMIEVALDKWYFQYTINATSKDSTNYNLFHSILKKDIDQVNAIQSLKIVQDKIDKIVAKDYFIENGAKITKPIYMDLISSKDIDTCLTKIEKVAFKEEFSSKENTFEKINDLSIFERAIEKSNAHFLWKRYRDDLLSFGVILGFIKLKYNEIVDLRIIANCKDFGMPLNIIEEELVFGKV